MARSLLQGSMESVEGLSDAAFQGPPKTGTTIVACVYDGGVVLGADTRVSTGIYVSNRASDKMTVLEDTTVMCRSGSAADTEAIASFVRYHVEQIGMERNGPLDVRTVARIANQINYQNKGANQGLGLSAYMIIGGWDEKHGAQVYSCTAGGNMIQNKWTTDGSGSTFIWGFMDEGFKVCFLLLPTRLFQICASALCHFPVRHLCRVFSQRQSQSYIHFSTLSSYDHF